MKIFNYLLPLMLISCAPSYKNIKTNTSANLSMGVSGIDEASICIDNKKYSAPQLVSGKSIYLEEGRKVTIQLGLTFSRGSSMMTQYYSCYANFTFIPTSAGEYKSEFVYEYDSTKQIPRYDKGCTVEIKKINNQDMQLIKTEKQHYPACDIKQ